MLLYLRLRTVSGRGTINAPFSFSNIRITVCRDRPINAAISFTVSVFLSLLIPLLFTSEIAFKVFPWLLLIMGTVL